ncbi:hypothetical protein bcgnr5378_05460 [Bacillus cereus]|uniref:Uncharacterized protein n=1 Tax=Bacillus cereus TaxID=1396 RepID=A0A164LCR1_BACCE|nr:hypothetical protein [Bacillus cereus]KZD55674.1 hypothetical protein B4088_5419 [Bacillus cereus]
MVQFEVRQAQFLKRFESLNRLLANNIDRFFESSHIEFTISELEDVGLDIEATNSLSKDITVVREIRNFVFLPELNFDGQTLKVGITHNTKKGILEYIKKDVAEEAQEKQLRDIVENLYRNHDIKDADVLASMALADIEKVEEILKKLG